MLTPTATALEFVGTPGTRSVARTSVASALPTISLLPLGGLLPGLPLEMRDIG